MKAFVTGANGFLGSHLVDRLLERGDEVHVLVRRNSNLQWLLGKDIRFHYGDIVQSDKAGHGLRDGIEAADVVFHLAGVIRALNHRTYYEVNAGGTAHLLELCREVKPDLKRVVLVTSLAAHGPGAGDRPAREADECHPITDYGKSKRDAELIARRYHEGLPIAIIRPPAIYGPRDDQVLGFFRMARFGIIPLPGWGRRILNLAHVQDVVSGILLASEDHRAIGETFYIGEDRNYEWTEAADIIASSFSIHRPFKIRVPKPLIYMAAGIAEGLSRLSGMVFPLNLAYAKNFLQRNWAIDVSKARNMLGYRSAYPLKRGAEETAAWYRDEGWL